MHISKLPEDQYNKLSFLQESFLLFRGSAENTQVMHKVSSDNFEKIKKLLQKDTDVSSVKPNSKVFILPNSTFKQPVIKEVCKKLQLKVVTDVNKADLIISNDNLCESVSYGDSSRMSSYLIESISVSAYHSKYYPDIRLTKFLADSRIEFSCKDYLDKIADRSIEKVMFNILGKGLLNIYDFDYDSETHRTLITDDCLEVIYNILKKSLPVIQDKTLFNSIEKVVIDKDYFETIKMMLSGSSEDQALAFEILYNCDINKSYYYLIKLKDQHYYAFYYRKGKNTKFHKALLNELSVSENNEEDFIVELRKRGCLTEEIYDELSKRVLKDALKSFHNYNDLKLFNIDVKIKSYSEYMNQNIVTEENV